MWLTHVGGAEVEELVHLHLTRLEGLPVVLILVLLVFDPVDLLSQLLDPLLVVIEGFAVHLQKEYKNKNKNDFSQPK